MRVSCRGLKNLAATLAISAAVAANAQEGAGQSSPSQDSRLTSVVVQLREAREACSGYEPISEKARANFAAFEEELEAACKAHAEYERDQANKERFAAYHDHVSACIQHLKGYLVEYRDSETEHLARVQGFKDSLKETKAVYAQKASESQEELDATEKRIEVITTTLTEQAERLRSRLEAGEDLPPELDAQIQSLDGALKISRSSMKLQKLRRDKAEAAVQALAEARVQVAALSSQVAASYDRAKGHIQVLNDLAHLQEEDLHIGRAIHDIGEFMAQMQSHQLMPGGGLERLIDDSLNMGLPALGEGEAPSSGGAEGREILLRFLTPKSPARQGPLEEARS